MNLPDYLYKNKIKQRQFAKICGISEFTMWRVYHHGLCGPETAKKIEIHSGGQVTAKELMATRYKKLNQKWKEKNEKYEENFSQKDMFE
jgi:hypothetical protein